MLLHANSNDRPRWNAKRIGEWAMLPGLLIVMLTIAMVIWTAFPWT